jgi:hypothetical protein
MNARTLVNIGLVALIAGAAALYFKPRPEQGTATFRVLAVPIDDVREIDVKRVGEPSIELRRDASGWRMVSPVNARLDEIALARVLELARATSANRLDATDLARFGLDKPWAVVTINAESVEFGNSNELTRELYLKRGAFVYAVPARIATAVPANAAKLIAHRLFAEGEKPRAFRLARFAVAYDGSRWQLEPPDPGLSQDDLIRWVDTWRHASSIITQPFAATPSGEYIRVELEDARGFDIRVVRGGPDLVLVRMDQGLEYHLPARLVDVLLAPPNAVSNTIR